MPEDLDIQQETWTYLGRVVTVGNKLDYEWETPHGDKIFSKFHPAGARPGTIWKVSCAVKDNGVISAYGSGANAPIFEGIVDDDRKTGLELASAAAETAVRISKQSKSDMEKVTLSTICQPLREAYRRQTTSVGKAALMARVMQEIQTR